MKKDSRKTQRRHKQGCAVIDSSLKLDSRVAVIRLDLSYQDGKGSADRLNSDLNKLRLNARSKSSIFKDQIGYVIKLEKGNNDNYHVHALFLFRGHEVKNHKYKAEQIGRYWQEIITKGDGLYHNCNTKEYDKNCLGAIERNDEDATNALKKNVAGYLCKDKQSIKNSNGSDKKIREFRCSVIKK
ncbi:MAG: inovirus-type Gp2 protein [Campylobacter sp.]|uniref:YagK/YfjJ domain-containing protein n=1 Tax=Campylobacter sp. TaxID=205 RepID=UPI002A80E5FC|nr:inovirus-type Gp2 protein [Campylobacter sp.]MDY5115244.1 inovirus-type Gp2 protein [Campylobacter sp.]